MSPPERVPEPFVAIVLAAQRAGVENPLAAAHGVSHKCLVPIGGRPLIAHVLATLAAIPDCRAIRVVIENEAVAAVRPLVQGMPVAFVTAKHTLTDSVFAAATGDGPFVVTTADNVLMTPASVDAVRAAMADGADVAVALTTRDAVLAAHPEGQRRFYELKDAGYANCNLYGLRDAEALKAAEVFRGGGQFAKNPGRLVRAFGVWNIVLLRLRLVTARQAMARISRRFGLDVRAVTLADGSQAVDVDNERTYRVVEALLPS